MCLTAIVGFVAACSRVSDPPRSRRTGVLGATVECNGRLRRGAVDGVDHGFKQSQPARWQTEARTDYYTVVVDIGEAALHGRDRSLVGVDEAVLGKPPPPVHIGERELDSSVDLLCGHAGRQRWIRKVHRRRIETDQ